MLMLHGSLYLAWKTEGEHVERLHAWILKLWSAFVILYVLTTIATVLTSKFLFVEITGKALFWLLLVFLTIAVAAVPKALRKRHYLRGFLASSLVIICALGIAALSMYPRLVPARPDLANSLTIYNSASSPLTLKVMLIIAGIGMPVVLVYTAYVYRTFRGKVTVRGGY